MSKEKFGPCIEKKCSFCCNPVKTDRFFPDEKIPKDKNDKPIWEDEGLAVKTECVDGEKFKVFKCKKFNKETGLCDDYENRPDICKESSCINEKSNKSQEDQYKKMSKTEFTYIKPKK